MMDAVNDANGFKKITWKINVLFFQMTVPVFMQTAVWFSHFQRAVCLSDSSDHRFHSGGFHHLPFSLPNHANTSTVNIKRDVLMEIKHVPECFHQLISLARETFCL